MFHFYNSEHISQLRQTRHLDIQVQLESSLLLKRIMVTH